MNKFVHCPSSKNMISKDYEQSGHRRSLWRRRAEYLLCRGLRRGNSGSGMDGERTRVVYDMELILELLMGRSEMSYEEAVEYFDYNIAGSHMGDYTPLYLET